MMDDRREKQSALTAITKHSDEILRLCEETVDILDALEEMKVFSLKEKDYANEYDDYSQVIPKLTEKINIDLKFFTDFCSVLTKKEEESISSLGKVLAGELTSRPYVNLLFTHISLANIASRGTCRPSTMISVTILELLASMLLLVIG
jgi:predicted RNA-binding protein with EMAP domain